LLWLFLIHGVLFGIMKHNRVQSNNTRDLGIAYILVFVFYSILGIAGMIALAGLYHHQYSDKIPESITELLVKSNGFLSTTQYIIGCFAIFLIFSQLTTVIPVLCFFTRRQMFEMVDGPKKPISKTKYHLFNIFYNVSCLGFQLPNLSLSKIIGFTGAVGGFLLIYIIPIYIHLKCLYFNNSGNTNTQSFLNEVDAVNTPTAATEKCRDHSNYQMKSKFWIYSFYGFLTLFGLAILFAQIIVLF